MNTYISHMYTRNAAIPTSVFALFVIFNYRSPLQILIHLSWLSGILAAIISFILIVSREKINTNIIYSSFLVSIWFLWALMVTPYALDADEHLKVLLITFIFTFLSLLMSHTIIESDISLPSMAFMLCASWAVVNVALAVMYHLGYITMVKANFSGVFHDRNVFSITTSLILIFSCAMSYGYGQIKRYVYIFFTFLCICLIFYSESITGVFGVAFFIYMNFSKQSFLRKVYMLIGLLTGICIALLSSIFDENIGQRFYRLYLLAVGDDGDLQITGSAYVRRFLIETGLQVVQEHPWVGIGVDNVKNVYTWPGRDTGTFLHNTYLDIATGGGVPMLILYYIPFFTVIGILFRCRRYANYLSDRDGGIYRASLYFTLYLFVYHFTWTSYYEFGMLLSNMFALYGSIYLRAKYKSIPKASLKVSGV